MKTKYNKLSPLDESKSAKCELLNDDSLKMNILKQKIIHERSSVLQRDGELRKISEELHNRIMNQRLNFNKPLKYAQFVIHQRKYDTKKNSNAVLNIVKKEQQLQLELSKRDVSQFASYEQEADKSQLIDKMPQNQKKLKMKYRDIVKSILIKSIAQSFHDDSINVINYHSKPKSISVNEQPVLPTNNNCAIKPIDQYILNKLENIAQDQLDNSYMPPLSQNEMKTSTQKTSLLKLIPITTATAESSKLKRIRCQDDFSNSKLIQEFKNDSGVKNYEITRKAQDRITLYQKILKMQNESRSQSQSCYIKKKIVNPIQNKYN
ncbi:unnamed protein product (macronuclear) [Paramecium tetraurelia]|uniref:Uncharacterized protein n=1 Tax=Paramecium tetraurelia TaxID=5888 RepID=A0EGV9_PARTE|nr:uncharacterized protein GSPATT00026874001 [Paramecium tetraurelia]CAK94550.1 unnamed protein product [Paramecium tetraurelia]|eukprot:XP_001461923.1 hypothetical protein (macronuclear) [Paramecium tetraurelia strain d4-2]